MKIPVIACLGSAAAAFATEPFDVNIYQPAFQGNELSANAWVAPRKGHRHTSPPMSRSGMHKRRCSGGWRGRIKA